jgi:hypothetical protein
MLLSDYRALSLSWPSIHFNESVYSYPSKLRNKHMVTRKSFVASLNNVSDLNTHYGFIDRQAKQGDCDTLRAVFTELCAERAGNRIPDWALRAVLERIVEALALTDGYENCFAALELAAVARTNSKRNFVRLCPRAIVSRIATAHSSEVIDRLLLNLTDLETRALLLHEAVVRRKLIPESAITQKIRDHLIIEKHPLASLPLTLFDFEDAILLPNYGIGSSGTSLPFGPTRERSAFTPATLKGSLDMVETTRPDRANLISAAVANWKDESNGMIEARTFRIDLPSRDTLRGILPKIGLESVGLSDGFDVRENVPVNDAFNILFSAASSGGAYNNGNFAAYGRLLAWRSLAGLIGTHTDALFRSIAADSRNCQWCLFDSSSEWYYKVAWDLGVACYNPGDRELAVLAATDTD